MIVVAGLAGPPARAAEKPEMLLSWNAPHGAPRASSGLVRNCGDTAAVDTLYLSYRLAEDHLALTGATALVMFHTSFGDSLSPFWITTEYPEKPRHLRVEFPSDTGAVFRAGWASVGFGDYAYYTEETRAIVRMIYAVPAFAADPIAGGRTYSLARILIDRTAARPGCDQAICVELFDAEFKFSINQPTTKGAQVRQSFATVNSESGIVCAQHRLIAEHREEVKLPPLPTGGVTPRPPHDH